MNRSRTNCLPSLDDNHMNHFTCFSDFESFYDIWWWIFMAIHSLLLILALITLIKEFRYALKTLIVFLINFEIIFNILYWLNLYNGLDSTDSIIDYKFQYIFPARIAHMLMVIIWLLFVIIWRQTLDNISTMSMKSFSLRNKTKEIIISILIFIICAIGTGVATTLFQDTEYFTGLLIANSMIYGIASMILIGIATKYIWKINKYAKVIESKDAVMYRNIYDLKIAVYTLFWIGTIMVIVLIIYQISLFNFWTPIVSMIYITCIYIVHFIQITTSLYITSDTYKHIIRKIVYTKSPKIAPLLSKRIEELKL